MNASQTKDVEPPVANHTNTKLNQTQVKAFRAALVQLQEEGKLLNRTKESASKNMKAVISRLAQGNAFFQQLSENMPGGNSTLYQKMHHIVYAQLNPEAFKAYLRPRQPGTGRGKAPKKPNKSLIATPKKKAAVHQDGEDTQTEHDTIHKAEPGMQTSPEKHTGYRSDMI